MLWNDQNLKEEKETSQNNFWASFANRLTHSAFQRALVKSAAFLRLGNSSSLPQGHWAALEASVSVMQDGFAKCIFRHFGAPCWDILLILLVFLGFRSLTSTSQTTSQKRPNWRLIQTFSFLPKVYWLKNHNMNGSLRYLSTIYWKHIAPSGLKQ